MKKLGKKEKINLLLWIIAILLCLVTLIIGIVGYFSYGFRGFDDIYVNSDNLVVDNLDMEIHDFIARGITLNNSGTNNNVINAIVEGPEGINKTLVWDIQWLNEDTWNKEKNVNDYVSMVVNTDTLSASVKDIKPFNSRIQIKVKSITRESVFATCALDYVKRIKTLTKVSNDEYINVSLKDDYINSGAKPQIDIGYSEGTLIPEYSHIITITYSDAMIQQITDVLYQNGFDENIDSIVSKNIKKGNDHGFSFNIVDDLIPNIIDDNAINLVNDLFIEQKNNMNWYCDVTIKTFIKYNNVSYQKSEFILQRYKFNVNNLTKKCVQSIQLDKNTIIF